MFWVHASSVARFEESYRQVAQQVGISVESDPKADVLSRVYNWLSNEQNGRWAMVVDNADATEVLFGSRSNQAQTIASNSALSQKPPIEDRPLVAFLPTSAHGSIVVTSRSREVTNGLIEYAQDILEVHPMTDEEAVTLLTSKLIATVPEPSSAELSRLVQELDRMPLAITQAAAYINQLDTPGAVSQYLAKLVKSDIDRDRLLQHDTQDPRRDDHSSNSIILTWHTSFERIRQVRSSAARLLALMCLFDRESIPKSLLSGQYSLDKVEHSRGFGRRLRSTLLRFRTAQLEAIKQQHKRQKQCEVKEQVPACDDDDDFEQDIWALRAYSLVGAGTDKQLLNMHRLVQYSTRKWLELHNALEQWQTRYACVLDDNVPDGEYTNWNIWQTLFPHVEMLMLYRARGQAFASAQAIVAYCGSWYAWEVGKYQAAERLARISVHNTETIFGPDDARTLNSVYVLSLVLKNQGHYAGAEEMCRRVLSGYEKKFKINNTGILAPLELLAITLLSQGKYSKAEELQRRVLQQREKTLGPNHPSTLNSVRNLAVVLWDQGKHGEAEKLLERALAGLEKELGASHPDTLASVGSLARVQRDQGRYREAEVLSQRALAGQEQELGAIHPSTLKNAHCLASILQAQGQYTEALQLYNRAVQGCIDGLGPAHPLTLECQEDQEKLLREMNTSL